MEPSSRRMGDARSSTVQAQIYEDFETAGLATRWTGIGDLKASRETEDGNSFVRVEADEGAILAIRPDAQTPEYEATGVLQFRYRVPDLAENDELIFEIQIYSGTRRGARFWRKLEPRPAQQGEWVTRAVPLALFRHSGGFHLGWDEVERFGFYFRNPGVLELDDIEWVPANDSHPAPHLTPEILAPLAFGEDHETSAVIQAGRFVVLTDAPLDPAAIKRELTVLTSAVAEIFPGVKTAHPGRIPLIVFEEEARYREFWPRFARAFNSQAVPPQSDGYAALGVATTWYDPGQGSVRPVLIQEACHALLAPEFGIGNRSEWLHEGLANYFQLPWSRQDLIQLNRQRIRSNSFDSLAELSSGESVPLAKYAQVALFAKWLVEDEKRLAGLKTAIERMSKTGDTGLAPVCKEAFGVELEELEARWHAWAQDELNSSNTGNPGNAEEQ